MKSFLHTQSVLPCDQRGTSTTSGATLRPCHNNCVSDTGWRVFHANAGG